MLKVLSRAIPDIRDQLRREVAQAARPVLVAQEKELDLGGPFERRMPYRYLLESGAALCMLVVADDPEEGLWRDPVGDLAEDLFDGKRAISEATSGYILLMEHGETDYVRRDLWDPMADVRAIAERAGLAIDLPPPPRPEPARRPVGSGRPKTEPDAASEPVPERPPEPPPLTEPAAPIPATSDPFAILGVPRTAKADELKKAFRGLIVLYHPDKVAHLGHEFQELAERKTRELTVAYDAAQRIVEEAAAVRAPDLAGGVPKSDSDS